VPVPISSKGQVTIPQAIREKAGLLPNTEVEFEMRGGKVLLKAAAKPATRAQQAVGRLRGSLKHIRMSTNQIMALTRGKV
jgi:AbrB family looped-hinge helix DNA binding protein